MRIKATDWEKTFVDDTFDKETLPKLYKEFSKLSNKKINNPVKKKKKWPNTLTHTSP